MTIQDHEYVDGGYGQTNNPSWETWRHYRSQHNLDPDQPIVMINLGTGTSSDKNTSLPPKRPIWTKLLPNGIVEAFGLVADLAKLATESESCAERLGYVAENNPEQLFFQRFSADTGIDRIKLDDWKAVTGVNEQSVIERCTKTYLEKADISKRLEIAAVKLADVYESRQNQMSTKHARLRMDKEFMENIPGIPSVQVGPLVEVARSLSIWSSDHEHMPEKQAELWSPLGHQSTIQ